MKHFRDEEAYEVLLADDELREEFYSRLSAFGKTLMAIINKTAPAQELIDAIKAALEGRPSASLDWARALEEDENFVGSHLSEREAQVITLYANGTH